MVASGVLRYQDEIILFVLFVDNCALLFSPLLTFEMSVFNCFFKCVEHMLSVLVNKEDIRNI